MTDVWPSAPSQGFLNFPILKYLGGDSVSGKAVHVWHFFTKICFPKRFAGFGLFGSRLKTVTQIEYERWGEALTRGTSTLWWF